MGIKIPVATDRTLGQRDNDFSWTQAGEPVYPGFVCARDEKDPDGGCGCGRSFSGLVTGKATTTAVIRELAMTKDQLREAVYNSYVRGGWITPAEPDPLDDMIVDGTLEEMLEIGGMFPAGSVIERRLDDYTQRALDRSR
jgi:hypothetical protein